MDLDFLLAHCRSLPGVEESVKWGDDRVFTIGGKMFCVFSIDDGATHRASFKVDDHRFLEMTDRPQFVPAPYLARARWVALVRLDGLDPAELTSLVTGSYQHYRNKLPKRIRDSLP